ncbi:hypothetical protein LshimejAT787_0506730 [Lyophyllum shimeji]|uniref:Uncharacterized protein n=1 Tax=Lyophyllum shimeji TaxID=47721 RepID=A0A9P3PNR4_LYOSH|nr:hypothetical protein LshimejAT787_0506730 [Lyophyllum shimeji]
MVGRTAWWPRRNGASEILPRFVPCFSHVGLLSPSPLILFTVGSQSLRSSARSSHIAPDVRNSGRALH